MHEHIDTISPDTIDFATEATLAAFFDPTTTGDVTGELGVTVRDAQPVYDHDDIGWTETAYAEIIAEAEALCAAETAADEAE